MKLRRLRSNRLELQRGAVPHRYWVRRHEWRWQFGRLWTGEMGRIESVRVVES